jgi:predicted permease
MSLLRWLYVLPLRLRSIFRRDRVEAELDDEIRDHIERQVSANVAAGMSHASARSAALAAFGRVEWHKESVRDTRGVTGVEHFLQDVRFAGRVLRKSPVFTAVAVLTLALGIGANSAIFGVVQSVLLRPLPFAHPDRLVGVFETDTHASLVGVSKLDFQDWRRVSTSFAHLAAAGRFGLTIKTNGVSSYAAGAQVSPELFQVLGVPPVRGTVFTATTQTAVISEAYWRQQFGGADVIGKTLVVDDTARVITGIMPAKFDFPHGVQVWIPQDMIPRVKVARTIRYWDIVADLKPGVTIDRAQKEMSAIAAQLAQMYPSTNTGVGVKVMSLAESLTGDARPTLLLLTSIAGLVLLLACANLANLMLVRGVTRRRELAVRTALGATQRRLRRQILTECLLVSIGGATVGLPLALWSGKALKALPQLRSDTFDVNVSNGVVFGFAALMAVLTTIIFGLAPAVRAARVDLVTTLKEAGGRGSTALGLSGSLVAAEVALATLLLVGAALTTRSLALLKGESLGFDAAGLAILRADVPGVSVADRLARHRKLLDDIRRLPGISAAAFADGMAFGNHAVGSLFIEGEPSQSIAWHQAIPHTVSEGYFQAMGVPIKQGRDFSLTDIGAERVAIVNEALVKADLSWRDPIGARIVMPEGDSAQWMAHNRGEETWATIVGVVGDVRELEYGLPPRPTVYVFSDQELSYRSILIRTSMAPSTVERTLIALAKTAGTRTPTVVKVSDIMGRSAVAPRLRALVVSAFAILALVLASIGVYGVTAHITAQRTAEIGIRIALGATPHDIFAAASGHVIRYAVTGLGIGMVVGLATSRLIRAFLYGIGPTDLPAFAAAGLIACAIACFAAWVPARRAMRINPTEALWAE